MLCSDILQASVFKKTPQVSTIIRLADKLLIIKSDNPMKLEDDVTEIDSDVQDDVHSITHENSQDDWSQTNDSQFDDESAISHTERELFLDQPLSHDLALRYATEIHDQDSNFSGRSFGLQQVPRNNLGNLSIEHLFDLVQLLHRAAISTREEKSKLEQDLLRSQSEERKLRQKLQDEAAVNRKCRDRMDKKCKSLRERFRRSQIDHAPKCGICWVNQTDMVLQCGHVCCKICWEEWREWSNECPFCRKSSRSVRPLYLN